MTCPECGAVFIVSAVFGTDDECPFCHADIPEEHKP